MQTPVRHSQGISPLVLSHLPKPRQQNTHSCVSLSVSYCTAEGVTGQRSRTTRVLARLTFHLECFLPTFDPAPHLTMNSVGDCTEAVVEAGLRSEGDVVTVEDGSEREEEEEEEEKEEEEEEGGRGEAASGPRDHIKVRVLEYQKTEDDYSYTMEVGGASLLSHHSNCVVLMKIVQVVVNEGKPLLLHHGYEHFKWIYRLLAQRIDIGGHIVSHM